MAAVGTRAGLGERERGTRHKRLWREANWKASRGCAPWTRFRTKASALAGVDVGARRGSKGDAGRVTLRERNDDPDLLARGWASRLFGAWRNYHAIKGR
jgi:hypothetical protein